MAWFSDWINSNYRREFLALSVLERSRFMAFHLTCTGKKDGWLFILILSCFFFRPIALWGPQETTSKINFNFPLLSLTHSALKVLCCLLWKVETENAKLVLFSSVWPFVIIKVLLHFWRSAYQQGSNLCITAATGGIERNYPAFVSSSHTAKLRKTTSETKETDKLQTRKREGIKTFRLVSGTHTIFSFIRSLFFAFSW